MANVSILWNKPSDRGTYAQGSWVASLPLAHLQTQDVQRVARSTSAAIVHTRFRVDLGTAVPEATRSFALLNHNGTLTATWRIVVTNDATDADPAQRLLDTGFVAMWVPTVGFGLPPWGSFPWSGIDARDYTAGTLAIYEAPAAVTGRYVWVYVADATNPAGYFQAGRFLAGVACQPERNVAYGAGTRYIDPSEVKRSRGGRRLVLAKPRYRQMELDFQSLTEREAFSVSFELSRQLGKAGDLLISLDPDDAGGVRFRRTFYAALADTTPIVIPKFNRWQWSITAEELI